MKTGSALSAEIGEERNDVRLIAPGKMRVGALCALPKVAARYGVSTAHILPELGLPASLLDGPNNTMSYGQAAELLQLVSKRAGDAPIGLLVGREAHPSMLGLVGFLMQQAPDVRTALSDLCRYVHHHANGCVVTLEASQDEACLTFMMPHYPEPDILQFMDLAVATGLAILRRLCGTEFTPSEVRFPRAAPAQPQVYCRLIGAPTRFDAEVASVVFSSRWLDFPLPYADPLLRGYLLTQVEAAEAMRDLYLSDEVRRVIVQKLQTSRLSAEEIARSVGMNKRTLMRHLAAEGTSISSLVSETRYRLACQMLRSTRLPLSEIALSLGYSEASAFTRAFRDWSGGSPLQWRSEQQRGAKPNPDMLEVKDD